MVLGIQIRFSGTELGCKIGQGFRLRDFMVNFSRMHGFAGILTAILRGGGSLRRVYEWGLLAARLIDRREMSPLVPPFLSLSALELKLRSLFALQS